MSQVEIERAYRIYAELILYMIYLYWKKEIANV